MIIRITNHHGENRIVSVPGSRQKVRLPAYSAVDVEMSEPAYLHLTDYFRRTDPAMEIDVIPSSSQFSDMASSIASEQEVPHCQQSQPSASDHEDVAQALPQYDAGCDATPQTAEPTDAEVGLSLLPDDEGPSSTHQAEAAESDTKSKRGKRGKRR